jgi:hypothetical protein
VSIALLHAMAQSPQSEADAAARTEAGGTSARESRALRKLLREAPASPYVFMSERRAPLSAAGYQRMVAIAGVAAKFSFLVHSRMLRHACGDMVGACRT